MKLKRISTIPLAKMAFSLSHSQKIFLISIAILFTALGLKVYVSLLMEFVSMHMPIMCNFFSSCSKPPYLYLIVNAIIITIVLSSKFHHFAAVDDQPERTSPLPKTQQLHAHKMKSPHSNSISPRSKRLLPVRFIASLWMPFILGSCRCIR